MKNLALHFRIIILYLNGKSATPTIHCTADVRYYECPYQLAPYDKTNLAEHSTITNIRINITLVSIVNKNRQYNQQIFNKYYFLSHLFIAKVIKRAISTNDMIMSYYIMNKIST